MISVCMATYNGGEYIKLQMESILKQLSAEDEVVVQDDCSQDETLNILLGLSDKRIKIQVNKKNQGVISTFQSTLKRARGDIIFLADQDDEWLPRKVEAVMEQLQKPEVIAVVTNAIIVDGTGRIIAESYFKESDSGSGVLRNFIHNSYLGCCLAFKREVLQLALPIPVAVRTHDGWIGLVANMLGEVVFLPEPYLKYKRHGKNASQMHRFPMKDVIVRRFILAMHMFRIQPTLLIVKQSIVTKIRKSGV